MKVEGVVVLEEAAEDLNIGQKFMHKMVLR
jgi:hypothetical protein